MQKFILHDVTFGYYSGRMESTIVVKIGRDMIKNIFQRPRGLLGGKRIGGVGREDLKVQHQLGGDLRAKVRDKTWAHSRLVTEVGELDVLKAETIAFMKGFKSEIGREW